ncbi:dTDP-4-dehydrorhamnose reductase [Gemmiger sp. An87]|uniref:dTDP-4-dehydrorhamnose reductase n=1 Tax=Allofournierella massiliensis TaxID=1650663 RepID=A0ABT7UPP2_9FIRM|nr:dTDP-4-dehydrorhamnose reductase [Fournierella massiliensis]MDM8200859.1 dTDP-4-dehydrorhamnose reductase [Fournierella massiliensis]OUN17637.1 dTDP-4-dehydrorhamnose reductase [Gemmiger sp. An87]
MKILITGASGQLGTEIQRQLKNGGSALGPVPERLKNATVIATDVNELDITDRDATIAFVRRHQPDTIISCAAFTNVDGCESNPEAAFKVNAIGASNLAQAAERINARLIHVSTDYVFRGEGNKPLDESERVDPKSVYGKTKALGEEYVKNFCHRYFIVRTAWLYGYAGKNFVKTIVNAGKKFGKLEVVSDQLGNPTNAEDLAHHILQLAVSHDYGVYHCTGEGICSWYEFASEIIRLSGVDATVAPCTSAEYSAKHPAAADRPAWSALENRMLACTVGNQMRDWKVALADFFAHWNGE